MPGDGAEFIRKLAAAVPETEPLVAEHMAMCGELLPQVLMGEVSRFAVQLHQDSLTGVPGARATLAALFAFVEKTAAEPSPYVRDLIGASFIENITAELAASADMRTLLGPVLRCRLDRFAEVFGLPLDGGEPPFPAQS